MFQLYPLVCTRKQQKDYHEYYFNALFLFIQFRDLGCISSVQESGLLSAETGVDVIIIKEDMADYKSWHMKLTQQGYKCAWYLRDTSIPRRQWVLLYMRHSTWVHKPVENERIYPSCKDYTESKGYNSTQIDCAECPAMEL